MVKVLEEGKDNLFKLAFLRAGRRANIVGEETMREERREKRGRERERGREGG